MHLPKLVVLLAALFAVPCAAVAAVPQSWKTTPYLLPEGDTTLQEVFADFRRLMNTPVDLSPGVKGPTASLGKPESVETFLDSLAARHGLTWFVFKSRLYVARQSESTEARLKIDAARIPELRAYLVGMKLFDERYAWVALPSRDEVVVQGPPGYVELVSAYAASLRTVVPFEPPVPPAERAEIMTFRLQYASAADVLADGTSSPRLGVASMLARLYGGYGSGDMGLGPSMGVIDRVRASMRAATRPGSGAPAASSANAGSGFVASGMARERDPPRERSREGSPDHQGGEPPSFEADTRLNMVIIRDRPSRRAEYERVIAALDIVTEQIALDATVIELPVNAMRDALAAVSANALQASAASGMPALLVPRAAAERAFQQVSRERQKDGNAAILTQGLVFSEDDPFALDFADTRRLPQYSTTIWETLARNFIPLKVEPAAPQRKTGIRLAGTAKYIRGRGVNVRLELSEDRSHPEESKATVARSTAASMSMELQEDQVLVLVNSSVWTGEDMPEPRARAVLIAAQRWQPQTVRR